MEHKEGDDTTCGKKLYHQNAVHLSAQKDKWVVSKQDIKNKKLRNDLIL